MYQTECKIVSAFHRSGNRKLDGAPYEGYELLVLIKGDPVPFKGYVDSKYLDGKELKEDMIGNAIISHDKDNRPRVYFRF